MLGMFNRVEFTLDHYANTKVLAFVECTSTGISFGQAKRFVFTDYSLPEPSENYECTTIHRDGKMVTHFAFADNLIEQKSPLANWTSAMSFEREFYDVGLSEEYLPNPKSDKRTKLVAARPKHLACKIWFHRLTQISLNILYGSTILWFSVGN